MASGEGRTGGEAACSSGRRAPEKRSTADRKTTALSVATSFSCRNGPSIWTGTACAICGNARRVATSLRPSSLSRKHNHRHTSPRCQALRQARSEKPRQEALAPKERERQVAVCRFRLKANARALGAPALRLLPPGRKVGRSQVAATPLHVALHTNV